MWGSSWTPQTLILGAFSFELTIVQDRVPDKEEWIQLAEPQASEEKAYRSSWRSPFLNSLSYSMNTWSICRHEHAHETKTEIGREREVCKYIFCWQKKKAFIFLGSMYF